MAVQINDNDTLRNLQVIQVNDSGSLRNVYQVQINDNGTLRNVYLRRITSPSSISAGDVAPWQSGRTWGRAAIYFQPTGIIRYIAGEQGTDVGPYVVPSQGASGVWLRASHLSGTQPNGSYGSWIRAGTSAIGWVLELNTYGQEQGSIKVDFSFNQSTMVASTQIDYLVRVEAPP